MKKLLPLLFCFPLLAQLNPAGEELHTMEGEAAVAAHRKSGGNEVLVITALERAKDIEHVFKFAKKNSSASALSLKLADGKTISSILSIDVMPGGTLMVIQTNSMKGQIYEVIRTENVQEVSLN